MGRVSTTLHLHAPYITHSTRTSFVLLLVSMWLFRAVHFVLQPARSRIPHGILRRFACRLGIYVDEVLHAAFGEAVKESVDANVADLPNWLLSLQISSP